MPGPSISHWGWIRKPDARIEAGHIIEGDSGEGYIPGNFIREILIDIKEVSNEETALYFIKLWGKLGFNQGVDTTQTRGDRFNGAVEYVLKDNPNLSWMEAEKIVAARLGPRAEAYSMVREESLIEKTFQYIRFAQFINNLSECKRLIKLFHEVECDITAVNYDTDEWIKGLSLEWNKYFIGDLDFWKSQYKRGYTQPTFNQYLLEKILTVERKNFSARSKRGVWIQLNTKIIQEKGLPEGMPVIMFDTFFRFIEYVLLGVGDEGLNLWPKRCADPKCKQLFFPNKNDQIYCPAPPGEKRSRCENRHGQELRRSGKGKKVKGTPKTVTFQ